MNIIAGKICTPGKRFNICDYISHCEGTRTWSKYLLDDKSCTEGAIHSCFQFND